MCWLKPDKWGSGILLVEKSGISAQRDRYFLDFYKLTVSVYLYIISLIVI